MALRTVLIGVLVVLSALRAQANEPRQGALPQGAVVQFGSTRFLHPGGLFQILFAGPKGVITRGFDRQTRLWGVASGNQIHLLAEGGANRTAEIAASTDGRWVALIGAEATLIDLAAGKTARQLQDMKGSGISILFSPDSKLIYGLTSDVPYVHCWETDTGNVVKKIPCPKQPACYYNRMAISRDGNRLAVLAVANKDIQYLVIDLRTGNEIKIKRRPDDSKGFIDLVGFNHHGDELILYDAQGLHFWKFAADTVRREALRPDVHFAFSPDGKVKAAVDAKNVRLIDLASGKTLHTLAGPGPVGFSPDGRFIAQPAGEGIQLWEVATGKPVPHRPGHQEGVYEIAVADDGMTIASADRLGVIVWDRNGKILAQPQPKDLSPDASGQTGLALSPDGKLLAMRRKLLEYVVLWDIPANKELRRFPVMGGHHAAFRFTRAGRQLAVGSGVPGGTAGVIFYDTADGKRVNTLLSKHSNDDFFTLFLSSDERLVAAGTLGRTGIRFWQNPSGLELLVGKYGNPGSRSGDVVWPLAFTKNGRSFWTYQEAPDAPPIGGMPRRTDRPYTLKCIEIATGKPHLTHKIFRGEPMHPNVALSPDETLIASSGVDSLIRVYDTAGGKLVHEFKGHHGTIDALFFSLDGKHLFSGASDKTILIWDLKQVKRLPPAKFDPKAVDFDKAWKALDDDDAATAYAEMVQLLRAGDESVAFLKARLQPGNAPVAAEHIAKQIAALGSTQFAVRQKATEELVKAGRWASADLRRALKAPIDLETRQRIKLLLQRLQPAKSPDRVRVLRAIETLESIATPAARKALAGLTENTPENWIVEEMEIAIQRIDARQ